MQELFTKIPAEKRDRVINAAMQEFATFGYENANTNKIAAHAHISVGSLFKYFACKEDLFLAVIDHCAGLLREAFDEVVDESDTFFVSVEKLLRRVIGESRSNPSIMRLYFELSAPGKDPAIQQAADELEGYSHSLYQSLILRGQHQGIIREDCDPGMFAFLLDNIFMMLQYSYSCEYYQERFRIYGGDDIFEQDDMIVEQTMKFIRSAFSARACSA